MFAGFFFLLLLSGGSTYNHTEPPPDGDNVFNQSHLNGGSEDSDTKPFDFFRVDDQGRQRWHRSSHCTYSNMINHFNLTDKVKFYMTRPTNEFNHPTNVTLDIYLYTILDVKEKDQELVAYFWINVIWKNEFIRWKCRHFCGINDIILPTELLWKPDIAIEEITKKDKLFQTQYLTVWHDGRIFQRNGMVLVSTCKMLFYRFPFDKQTCKLTFKSSQHDVDHIKLLSRKGNDSMLEFTRRWMQNESEWLLVNVTVKITETFKFGFYLSVLVYTVTIKRRSVLYVVNFVVPILFFLCLDLASFMISESGGEKLSFQVTVLLAVTVMQLILNDILPSASDRIPLIAVYCIGVFSLMMLSLLETILMMYLMERDKRVVDEDRSQGDDCRVQQGKVQSCFRDIIKSIPRVHVCDEPHDEMPPELLPESISSPLVEEIYDLQNVTDELRDVLKAVCLLLSNKNEKKGLGYWTRKTKTFNRIYFVFYIITTCVFLGFVFSLWVNEDADII